MEQNDIYKKAIDIIHNRRFANIAKRADHIEEVKKKVPEIADVMNEIAGTSLKISEIIINRKGENTKALVEEVREKNIEAQNYIRQLLRENGYPEDYIDEQYYCEKCKDTGYINGKRCSCVTDAVAKIKIDKLNEGSQLSLCNFDTFDLNFYPQENHCREDMQMVYEYCLDYAENFSRDSKSVYMFGSSGLGKTHLSLSIANKVIERGYNVIYDSIMNLLLPIEQEHFGRSEGDTLNTLLNVDLLILDDLGTEFPKPFYISAIYTIINTRIFKHLPTIVSTNFTAQGMRNVYDERIVSRLLTYDLLKFSGEDIRLLKKKYGMDQE